MEEFATWDFINVQFGFNQVPVNEYPARQQIENLTQLIVNGSYAQNELVKESDCLAGLRYGISFSSATSSSGAIKYPRVSTVIIGTIGSRQMNYTLDTINGSSGGGGLTQFFRLMPGDSINITFTNTLVYDTIDSNPRQGITSYPGITWNNYTVDGAISAISVDG